MNKIWSYDKELGGWICPVCGQIVYKQPTEICPGCKEKIFGILFLMELFYARKERLNENSNSKRQV